MQQHFKGRVLFLSEDPKIVARQLAGEDLALEQAGPLRNDISTDEITPVWVCYYFDEKLGDYPYVGLKCGEEFPVKQGAVKAGGFAVTVAGRRYGKGSSREASPYAEWAAGIRLIIAESFERIYRQNCRNLGVLTSTDFGLIERIRAGEAIALEEFTRDVDPITAEIIRRGGLFAFTRARLEGGMPFPLPTARRKMTLAEKIIARAAVARPPALGSSAPAHAPGVSPGDGVFVKTDWRYSHEYVTPMAAAFLEQHRGKDAPIYDPASVLCFADHLTFIHRSMPPARRALGLLDAAQNMAAVQQAFCDRHGIRLHGYLPDREGSEGISHSIMAERYALPGQVIVGTDSHTPHCGALGSLAFGIGATDMANAWVTGDVRITVPPTCLVRLNGRLPEGVEAKDVVLHLLRLPYVREGRAIGRIIEYAGPALASLSTDERATLTNMVAEIGGFTGIVAPDAETVRFLRERRGIAFELQDWMRGDEGAHYDHVIEVDCSALQPMLARPGDPGRGIDLSELDSEVAIDIAYGGSCTGGKREDLVRYHRVLKWGVEHGMTVAPGVRFYLQFGSQDVRDFCERENMFPVFRQAGVELLEPGCGACVNAGPGTSERADQVTVSAINRNFPGRSGPGQMWLASPSTVAASALAGKLTSFDQLRASRAAAME